MGATASNVIDGRCRRAMVDDSDVIPIVENPGGNRPIVAWEAVAPGGVSTNVTAWFDASNGTSTTTPNDGSFTFTIEATQSTLTSVNVLNVVGEVVYSKSAVAVQQNNRINLGGISSGVYLLQITNENGISTKRFSIK